MTDKVVFLRVSDTSPWTVPGDFTSTNTIEVIGGGGGGGTGDSFDLVSGGGGGGGAYAKIINLALTPGATVNFHVGAKGAGGTIQVGSGAKTGGDGGDTWFNATSLASSSVGAKGGVGGSTGGGASQATGGAGGASASSVGTTKNSGGAGGTGSDWSGNSDRGPAGAGGGGAAGPNGVGAVGGGQTGSGSSFGFLAGAGGGGANGGSAGQVDLWPSTAGGQGGNGRGGTGGGAAGFGPSGSTPPPGNGGDGTSGTGAGGGGGGGFADNAQSGGNGGGGAQENIWTQTSDNTVAGPAGGGGGGGSGGTDDPTKGGNGGTSAGFGAGGGGGGFGNGTSGDPAMDGPGGDGADGIIVITYTPGTASTYTLSGARGSFALSGQAANIHFSRVTTRLYLQNAAAGYSPATFRGSWDNTASAVIKKLGQAKNGTSTTAPGPETSTTNNFDVLLGQFVSDPFTGAVSFLTSNTLAWIAMVTESNASANDFFHIHAYVTTGDSDTPRGTILANSIGATEWTTTNTGRGEGTKALSALSVSVGDRLVVEIGYQGQNTSATSFTGTLRYGGTGADSTQGTTTTSTVGWVEFTSQGDPFGVANTYTLTAAQGSFALSGEGANLDRIPSTFDPNFLSSGIMLSGGNKTAAVSGGGATHHYGVLATVGRSTGKYVFSMTPGVVDHDYLGASAPMIANRSYNLADVSNDTQGQNALFFYDGTAAGVAGFSYQFNNTGVDLKTGAADNFTAGSRCYVAVDIDNGIIWIKPNALASWNQSGSANPDTGAGGLSFTIAGPVFPGWNVGGGNGESWTYDGTAPSHGLTTFKSWDAMGGSPYTLGASTGMFALSGQAASLKRASRLTAGQGSLTFSGQAAILAHHVSWFNPSDKASGITLSNGNLTAVSTIDPPSEVGVRVNLGRGSGKYGFRFRVDAFGDVWSWNLGIANAGASLTTAPGGSDSNGVVVSSSTGGGTTELVSTTGTNQLQISASSLPAGVYGYFLADLATGKCWVKVPGLINNWNGDPTANPDTGVNGFDFGITGQTLYPVFCTGSIGGQASYDGADISGAGASTFGAWDQVSIGDTLAAVNGGVVLSGQNVSFKRSLRLMAGLGTPALTGEVALLVAARKLLAAQGGVALTGEAMLLITARVLAAAQGSIALTGEAAALNYSPVGSSHTLSAGFGSFTDTGESASLVTARKILAAFGVFAVTREPAILTRARTLPADWGSVAFGGEAAALAVAHRLDAFYAGLMLTGEMAALSHGRIPLDAVRGDFLLTSESAGFFRSRQLLAMPGVFFVSPEASRLRVIGWAQVSAQEGSWDAESVSPLAWIGVAGDVATWSLDAEIEKTWVPRMGPSSTWN